MRRRIATVLVSFLLFVWAAATAQAGVITPSLEAMLQAVAPDAEIPVLVTFTEQVDVRQFTDHHRAQRRTKMIRALQDQAERIQPSFEAFMRAHQARGMRRLWLINGMTVTARGDVIRALAHHPFVARVQVDAVLSPPQVALEAATAAEWNMHAIRAPEVWALGYRGQGVVVASMDTGVDSQHADLAGRWRGGTNSWYDPHGQHATPYDDHGHGTQTMGLIVGGGAGGSAIGVAPDARWIAVKIFNDADQAPLSAIHLGFQWLLDPDGNPNTDDAPDVVNNSWGFEGNPGQCIEEFRADIQALKAAGIAVVFAGGNAGPNAATSVSPANNPEAFAVGATDAASIITFYSSAGPSACDSRIYPDVVAPGASVKTADLTFGGILPLSYAYVDGTSFAAPHVAGAMALLRSAVPTLTVPELESALKQSAVDLGASGPDHDYGYGLIDVMRAYSVLDRASPPVTSGVSVSPNPSNGAAVVTLTATADASQTSGLNIAAAEWWKGTDPGAGQGTAMAATDGTFNSPTEGLTATINVSTWAPGASTLFVRNRDSAGNWGAPASTTVTVTAPPLAHQETRTGGSKEATTVTAANVTGVSGQLYLAAIATRPRVNVSTVSGLGLTWTPVRVQCAGRNQTGITVWMAQGVPSGNGPVTATLATKPKNATMAVSRYAGVNAVTPIGNVVSGNTRGVNGTCSGGTDSRAYSFNRPVTTSGALVYAAAAMRQRTHTPGAGYTERADVRQGTGSDAAGIAAEDKPVAAPATVVVNGTFSDTVDWAVVTIEIKP